jgi:hypothetical protein
VTVCRAMFGTPWLHSDEGPPSRCNRFRRSPGTGDGGYVLALMALALIPLVAITALAVDHAVWQARAAALQRAADAAALAGAGMLADPAQVVAAARDVAARNGMVDGVDGVVVDVDILTGAHVQVRVADQSVARAFSTPFLPSLRLERVAVAESVQPVALGSPRNFLGTGNLAGVADPHVGLPGLDGSRAEDFWLAVSGPCASREQGDWLLAVSIANFESGNPPTGERPWRGCTPQGNPAVQPVDSHDPNGYFVAVRVPATHDGGPFTIQVYDAARCADSPGDFAIRDDPFHTRFTVRDADITPADPTDNPPLAMQLFATSERCGNDGVAPAGYQCGPTGSWKTRWCNLATIDSPVAGGTYFVQAQTGDAAPSRRHQLNSFALRVRNGPAVTTGGFVPCSTDATDTAVVHLPDTCVQVSAVEWMSVFALGALPRPSFFLAEVGPEHSGGVMEVSLYDIGEGSVSLQVLDPMGTAVGFEWSVDVERPGDVPAAGGPSGTIGPGGALDLRGNISLNSCGSGNPQRGPGRNSSSKYNDRMLRLRIQLPGDIEAAWGGKRWWRVRYGACEGRGVSDRTTWGVRIDGEPLRLVR